MKKQEDFTTSVKDGNQIGVDASGKVLEVVGYTYTKSPSKSKQGHYVLSGPSEINPEDANCFSKKEEILNANGSTRQRYFVKVGTDGSIFNPWGLFSEGTQSNYAKRMGKSRWNFKEVNKRCFELYNNFLESRNQAWLANAEREIR